MNKSLFCTLLLITIGIPLASQSIKINYKPGVVSVEELKMDSYPLDTTAAALILCKSREVKVGFDSRLNLRRTDVVSIRYKVLKEEGKDCADKTLYYLSDNQYNESYSNIRVTTYNLEGGKTVQSKLSSKLIFRDNYSDRYKQVSFSAPDVRVGSVIEVQYSFSSDRYWDIGTLFMQELYPVNHGVITMEFSDYFMFNRLTRGYLSFSDVQTDRKTEVLASSGNNVIKSTLNIETHIAEDVPAFKREPYCFYPDQSRFAIEYELRSVQIPGVLYKDFSTKWEDVDRQFVEAGMIKELNVKIPFSSDIKDAVSGIEDEKMVIETVRALVLEKVKWNGNTALFPDTNKALKNGTGNSADLCGVMASALKEIGYQARPVLIKTRDKGLLAAFHVTTDAFNVMILKIQTPSNATYYTDVADPTCYLNVLPAEYLVDRARILPEFGETGSWTDLSRLTPNTYTQQVIETLSADGTLNGELRVSGSNEYGMELKRNHKNCKDNEEYISYMENKLGVEISELSFSGDDKWSPKAGISLVFSTTANVSGDYIYVNPFVDKFHYDTDFQNPVRRSMIDFNYPSTIKYSYTINYPDDYVIDQMPQNSVFVSDVLGAKTFVKYIKHGENSIMMSFSSTAGKTRVMETDYDVLRKYWTDVCNLYNATIVLKKK